MTTVAYFANAFPSPVEPYVGDEIFELRKRGVRVICCSATRVPLLGLSAEERRFRAETRYIIPALPLTLNKGARLLMASRRELRPVLQAAVRETASADKRVRMFAHTLLGAALAAELESSGVDHVHAHHGYYGSWVALIASRLLGVTFSFTLHGSDLLLHENRLGTKLRFCQFCMTVSNYNRDYILRKFPSTNPSKIMVQRLGVDTSELEEGGRCMANNGTPLLLAVGRLNEVKNHAFLIQACAALHDEGRDLRCWIAGEGPERKNLQRQIHAQCLQDRVRLLGHVPRKDLFEVYRQADLVVLTSRSEGIPLVLMEAMAQGCVVLAPGITGVPELIEHGKNGFLYRADSLLDFLDSVRWILDRRFCLEDVCHAARKTISADYNRQRNVASFADHFLERLGAGDDHDEDSLLQQVQLSV